jgi:hypothetical protein
MLDAKSAFDVISMNSRITIVLILDLTGRITLLAGCSWYPSRLLKSTVHHRLYIQWAVSNQCNVICAGRN